MLTRKTYRIHLEHASRARIYYSTFRGEAVPMRFLCVKLGRGLGETLLPTRDTAATGLLARPSRRGQSDNARRYFLGRVLP